MIPYYTGGSSTFSPLAGYGCVNSRQSVFIDNVQGRQTFEVYTMPHEETDVLNMQITVYDESEIIMKEMNLEAVPVTRNRVTQYTGDLMNGSPMSGNVFNLTGDDTWSGTDGYVF